MGEPAGLWIRVLGPLQVCVDGRVVPLRGAKQRWLMAALVAMPNRVVSSDRLVDMLTTVDGYLQASHRTTPPEAWDDFDTQVHGLYTQMLAVRITPTWAKLLDFETTAPSAVEQLLRQRSQ